MGNGEYTHGGDKTDASTGDAAASDHHFLFMRGNLEGNTDVEDPTGHDHSPSSAEFVSDGGGGKRT